MGWEYRMKGKKNKNVIVRGPSRNIGQCIKRVGFK
jgi:hypothetical protein